MKSFKNDLEMWHEVKEFSKVLERLAEFNEIRLINLCRFYEWDSDASEEYCYNCAIIRKKDFNSKEECWKCSEEKKQNGLSKA